MADPWVVPLTGMTLGGYSLDEFIDRGQFGLVFGVTKVDTGASFAMKVLPPNPAVESLLDFDNEGILLKKLTRCSSVIKLIESGHEQVQMTFGNGMSVPVPVRYHVLARASGNLAELVGTPDVLAKLAWPERIGLWRGAVKGVHQMHLKSVVHRDLKSSNCLVMVGGSRSEVRVADLGRSKDLTTLPVHLPEAYLQGLGDFRYAAPEHLWLQAGDQIADFRNADLYGLGSLLVELATGHPMTALAMTSWMDARAVGIADRQAGFVRDLATLRPLFRAALEGVAEQLPRPIRQTGTELLMQLCDPVPAARPPKRAPGKRRLPDAGLLWLLHQADLLGRQLAVEPTRSRYRTRAAGRSA